VAPPSENTATVVYSHCTNRFEHHTVAVFSLGGATAEVTNLHAIRSLSFQNICNEIGWPRFFAPPCIWVNRPL